MKRYVKRVTGIFLVVLMVFTSVSGLLLNVCALSYSGSSSYESGKYYTALKNVTLTGNQRTDIVNIAKSQIGYLEGADSSALSGTVAGSGNCTEYGRWYGLQDMWCQMFVSWCAYNAGVSTSVIAKTASTVTGLTQFLNNGRAYSRETVANGGYTPQAGDIVYFKSSRNDRITNHVGIVTGYANGTLSTIEGNTSSATVSTNGGAVLAKSYRITNTYIVYICCPAYTGTLQTPGVYSVTATGLRLRAGAGTSFSQVGSLSNGQKVEVNEITDGWGKITVGGVTGYASMKYLSFVSVLPTAPEYTVTASALNVRAGVGTGYAVLGTLPNAARVYVTATDSGWALIRYNGLVGWASMKYLTPVQTTKTYSVRFDANGGDGSMTNQTFTVGTAQNLALHTFTRTGYTFLGWATTQNATEAEYTDGASVKDLTSANGTMVTLYAVWQQERNPWEREGRSVGGRYYFLDDATGEYVLADGFCQTDGGVVCYENGYRVTGWRHSDGSSANVTDGIYEQYSTSPNGLYYFLYGTGYMVTDATYTLGGYLREFSPDHTVKPLDGLQNRNGILYYYKEGVAQTGWHTVDGNTYYFQASDAVYGQAMTMWSVIGGKVYYFCASDSATPYALKTSGTIGGVAYTFDPADGHIRYNGFLNCAYANAKHENSPATVTHRDATARYFLDGKMQYGWISVGGEKFYLYLNGSANGSGYLCTTSRTVGGVWHTFREDGVCTD